MMSHEERITSVIRIKFKISLIRLNLYDYSDAYISVKETITIVNTGTATASNKRNKKVIFKNCASFINCIGEIKTTQVDDAHDIDVVRLMYNLIQYSNRFSKILGSSWKQYRDEPALNDNGNIIDFHNDNNNSISLKFKQQ